MKLKTGASILVACCALLGCKANVWMPVTVSQAQGPATDGMTRVIFQVPSCVDKTTGLESESVLKAKQQLAFVWKGAKYCDCVNERYEHFVRFDAPLKVGNLPNGVGAEEVGVNIDQKGNGFFAVGSTVRERFNQLIKDSYELQASTMRFRIVLTNDQKKDLPVYVLSGFVRPEINGTATPVHDGTVTQPAGTQYVYTMSDAAQKSALTHGFARIFAIQQ